MSFEQMSDIKHELLVSGYCREQAIENKLVLHSDIVSVCIGFHGPFCERLKFGSGEWICTVKHSSVAFSDNDRIITKMGQNYHTDVIADIEPLHAGIHCFRVKVFIFIRIQKSRLITYGLG